MNGLSIALLILIIYNLLLIFGQTQINIINDIIKEDVYRLGLNLGGRSTGNHMMKNMIDNPGFEAREKATVMLADGTSTTTKFVQSQWTVNNKQPNGYWDNANFIFLTGSNQGVTGKIVSFVQENNYNTFILSVTLSSAPKANDVMVVTAQFPSAWNSSEARPNSEGKQSMLVQSSSPTDTKKWSVVYDGGYRDTDYTIGKSILISGSWTLHLWAKASVVGEKFTFFFGRETWAGGKVFFSKTYTLNSTNWIEINEQFTISSQNADKPFFPTGPCQNWPSCQRPLLEISLSISNATIAFDDLSLIQDGDVNPTVFTDRVVNLLKEYNPGVLRNWGNQFGASLKSELTTEFERTTHGYKPTDGDLSDYSYSLHDFLVLCKWIGADPYYVVPPTFFPDEAEGLIEYLAGTSSSQWGMKRITLGQSEPWTSVFNNIYLEYGNELWGSGAPNDPFGGASMGGANLGKAANFTFSKMRQSNFFMTNIKLIIGGQAGWSGQNDLIESNANQHDILALAPYFGDLLVSNTTENSYGPLYAFQIQERTSGNTNQTAKILSDKGHGTSMAIYEINFHYTTNVAGSPPPSIRNPWMTGVAGGINLPWAQLNYLKNFGAQPSCAFSFLGYSFLYGGAMTPFQCDYPNCSFARLWGLMRDLSGLGTKRPTFLANEIVNKAIYKNLIITTQSGDNPSWTQSAINSITSPLGMNYINSFAFSNLNGQWSLIVFNLHLSQSLSIKINPPTPPTSNVEIYQLSSTNTTDGNEVAENVTIKFQSNSDFSSGYLVTLPPFSLTAFKWTDFSYSPITPSPDIPGPETPSPYTPSTDTPSPDTPNPSGNQPAPASSISVAPSFVLITISCFVSFAMWTIT